MSWSSGAQLFAEIWPSIRTRVPDARQRRAFLDALLPVFLEWDVDPEMIVDVHPEVHQALDRLGVQTVEHASGQDDVAACVRDLAGDDAAERLTAAQAIEFFVQQSADPQRAAKSALQALTAALGDSPLKVQRAAALAIAGLTADGFPLPPKARRQLERTVSDMDDIVKKRINAALKRQSAK